MKQEIEIEKARLEQEIKNKKQEIENLKSEKKFKDINSIKLEIQNKYEEQQILSEIEQKYIRTPQGIALLGARNTINGIKTMINIPSIIKNNIEATKRYRKEKQKNIKKYLDKTHIKAPY